MTSTLQVFDRVQISQAYVFTDIFTKWFWPCQGRGHEFEPRYPPQAQLNQSLKNQEPLDLRNLFKFEAKGFNYVFFSIESFYKIYYVW